MSSVSSSSSSSFPSISTLGPALPRTLREREEKSNRPTQSSSSLSSSIASLLPPPIISPLYDVESRPQQSSSSGASSSSSSLTSYQPQQDTLSNDMQLMSLATGSKNKDALSAFRQVFIDSLDPIDDEMMENPIVLSCGHSYDIRTITPWAQQCKDTGKPFICPLDRKRVTQNADGSFTTNFALRALIQDLNRVGTQNISEFHLKVTTTMESYKKDKKIQNLNTQVSSLQNEVLEADTRANNSEQRAKKAETEAKIERFISKKILQTISWQKQNIDEACGWDKRMAMGLFGMNKEGWANKGISALELSISKGENVPREKIVALMEFEEEDRLIDGKYHEAVNKAKEENFGEAVKEAIEKINLIFKPQWAAAREKFNARIKAIDDKSPAKIEHKKN